MMKERRISKMANEALRWLQKMSIDVETADVNGAMYRFLYNDVEMFITSDTSDRELYISAPVYFMKGANEDVDMANFDMAKYMTRKDLQNYDVEYVSGTMSYVGQTYQLPAQSRVLRRYQLIEMLDDMVRAHETFSAAAMVASAPIMI